MRTSHWILPLRSLRLLVLCVSASVALYGASCSSSGSEEEEENPELADVVYEGETNDEALEQLLAAMPVDDAGKAPVFDTPTEGATLPAATPAKFSWHTGEAARAPSSPARRFASVKPRPAASPLVELFGPERAAHAHGEPYNGTGYLLVFSTPSDAKLVRVFTASTSYTPSAEAWDKMKAAGTLTVSITSGIFTENNIDTDGGPYKGKSVSFSVK